MTREDIARLDERTVEHKIAVLKGKRMEVDTFLMQHLSDMDKADAKALTAQVKSYDKQIKPLEAHYAKLIRVKEAEANKIRTEAIKRAGKDLVAKHCKNSKVVRVNGVGEADD